MQLMGGLLTTREKTEKNESFVNIIFINITIIENHIMVHTTATTLHYHYDLEKAGYRGI